MTSTLRSRRDVESTLEHAVEAMEAAVSELEDRVAAQETLDEVRELLESKSKDDLRRQRP